MPRRVAIIGLNHPQAKDPQKALWPDPVGSAGHGLWKLTNARTGATKFDYLQAFHRYHLGADKFWHQKDGEIYWREMEDDIVSNFDTVVFLGISVRRAAGLLLPDFFVSRSVIAIPLPTSKWYTDDLNRQMAEILMEELYYEAVQC